MVCANCQFETENEYNFCPNCGQKFNRAASCASAQETAEENPAGGTSDNTADDTGENLDEEQTAEQALKLTDACEEEHADEPEDEPFDEQAEASVFERVTELPAKKRPGRVFTAILSLFTVCVLAVSGILYFNVFNKTAEAYSSGGAVVLPANEAGGRQKIENIYIPEKEITLFEGSSRRINIEVYPPGAELDGIVWSCSGDGVTVSQTGRVTAVISGYKGTITVSCGDVKAEAGIRVLTRDEAFYEAIDWIARKEYYQSIYVDENKQVPLPIKPELLRLQESEERRKWGANLFARINDELPTYNATQKQLINKETGNKIDCDIYTEPVSGDLRKIVKIEYFGDYIEVTDYYFINGKLGFVFERNESYYRPSPANWGIVGTRLYFEDDAMTTWRDVSKADDRLQRDAAFVKTDYLFGQGGIEWNRTEYTFDHETNTVKNIKDVKTSPTDEEEAQAVKEYAAIEARALNAAYNLYDKISEIPDTVILSGCVVTTDALPMKGVSVKVFSERYGMLVSQTVTADDGTYSITAPNTDEPYTVYVSQDGYLPTRIYDVDTSTGTSGYHLPEVSMIADTERSSDVLLSVTDAFTGENSDFYERGGILKLRTGLNRKAGDEVDSDVIMVNLPAYNENDETSAHTELYAVEGIMLAEWLPDKSAYKITVPSGNYTAELLSSNRETAYFTLSVSGSESLVSVPVVQKLHGDEAAIVLTWGAAPQDLDARLYVPSGEHVSSNFKEIGRTYHMTSCDSGYGPETIMSRSLESGTYKYYVSDITNSERGEYTSKQMSNSFACVSVYSKDGMVSQFYIPRNVTGVLWHVFNISNGKVIPVQRYYTNISDLEQ